MSYIRFVDVSVKQKVRRHRKTIADDTPAQLVGRILILWKRQKHITWNDLVTRWPVDFGRGAGRRVMISDSTTRYKPTTVSERGEAAIELFLETTFDELWDLPTFPLLFPIIHIMRESAWTTPNPFQGGIVGFGDCE